MRCFTCAGRYTSATTWPRLHAHVARLGALELSGADAEQIKQLDERPLRRVLDVLQDRVEVRRGDVAARRLLVELAER